MREGEIACSMQFLLFHNVFQSYICLVCQNVVLCGNGLTLPNVKTLDKIKFKELADNNIKRAN